MLCDSRRVETDLGPMWLPADDQVILPYLRNAREWEPEEGRLLLSLLRPGSSFLDVGANIGYFSILSARASPGGSIDAVEPEPRNLALLRLNLWMHAAHAQIWPVALGQHRHVVGLSTETNNPGNTRVEAMVDRTMRLAALVRGDELFEGRRFDVIKIDVQGYERDVVVGLSDTIRRSQGVAIVTEFFPASLTARGMDPMETLDVYRRLKLERVASVGGKLIRLEDEELIALCASSGRQGFVNLLLRHEDSP